jgi:hypothetical protein
LPTLDCVIHALYFIVDYCRIIKSDLVAAEEQMQNIDQGIQPEGVEEILLFVGKSWTRRGALNEQLLGPYAQPEIKQRLLIIMIKLSPRPAIAI